MRRPPFALLALGLTAAFAACSTGTGPVNTVGTGPNFASQTLYASNSSQNAISIYSVNPAAGAVPTFQIGGSNTGLTGPTYLAFDSSANLWTINRNVGAGAASLVVIKALATGNVFPLEVVGGSGSLLSQPNGIAFSSTGGGTIAVANVNPSLQTPSQILFFADVTSGLVAPKNSIEGAATNLNIPSGVAFDSNGNVFVANRGNASIESFAVPTPVPTATPTPAGATPSPTPSPTPSGATPPPVANNAPPLTVISGAATGLVAPVGLTLDASGNIYVTDVGVPAIYVYPSGANGAIAPMRTISGSTTGLVTPIDVKVDAAGNIYVADIGAGSSGKVLVFPPNANGNVAPTATINATGALGGIGLSP